MKGLGLVLIAVGGLLVVGAIFAAVTRPHDRPQPAPTELQAENGETLALLPLLAVVSLATGGALVVASKLTTRK